MKIGTFLTVAFAIMLLSGSYGVANSMGKTIHSGPFPPNPILQYPPQPTLQHPPDTIYRFPPDPCLLSASCGGSVGTRPTPSPGQGQPRNPSR
jgi:hypothetical protein